MFSNQRGNILIIALGLSVFSGITAMFVSSQMTTTSRLEQLPQIRTLMAQVETRTRILALTPAGYVCGATGPSSCNLRTAAFENLSAETPSGTVRATALNFNPATARFTARISYNSPFSQMAVRDGIIDMTIPFEVLQDRVFECPDATPVFAGYKTTPPNIGSPICNPVAFASCPPGQYVSRINPVSLDPVCSPIGRSISCADQDYISNFSWSGVDNVTHSCLPRINPFTNGFSPTVVLDNAYSSQDPDVADPVPVIPPDEVVTWVVPAPEPANACTPPPLPPAVFGICHPSTNGGSFSSTPAPLCSAGVASAVNTTNPALYTWTCFGQNGGTNNSCSATRTAAVPRQDGICGPAHESSAPSTPTSGLCQSGTATAVAGAGPWTWQCVGVSGGVTTSCRANLAVIEIDGVCGASHDTTVATAPTTSLCSAGNSTPVSGVGPWTWQCTGTGGGTSVACTAHKTIVCAGTTGQACHTYEKNLTGTWVGDMTDPQCRVNRPASCPYPTDPTGTPSDFRPPNRFTDFVSGGSCSIASGNQAFECYNMGIVQCDGSCMASACAPNVGQTCSTYEKNLTGIWVGDITDPQCRVNRPASCRHPNDPTGTPSDFRPPDRFTDFISGGSCSIASGNQAFECLNGTVIRCDGSCG